VTRETVQTQNFGGAVVGRTLLYGYAVVMLAVLCIPIVVIVPMSFSNQSFLTFPPPGWSLRWYQEVLDRPRWILAAWNSLRIGVPVAVLSAILGTFAALAVARGAPRSSRMFFIFFLAPMMLPHIVIAIGLYPTLVAFRLAGTYIAVVIGHTVIGVPLVFVTVSAGLRSYPATLDLAARTLGAGAWKAFWRVTFPMIWPSIATGAILALITSFDELMLALFLTSPQTETIPRLIWDQLSYALTPTIAAAASLILLISMVLFVGVALVGSIRKRGLGK
jgi:ABC-type spermidine/putrescine transport system permease subunit II